MLQVLIAAIALLATVAVARAELPGVVKIGVLNDMSGPFADQSGPGSVVAAQMAADDFKREVPEIEVEIIGADHQNKADIGSGIVRQWLDQDGVAAIADAVNSSVALAVNDIVRDRGRTFIASNAGTSDLTGKACAPTTVQWTFDTWSLGASAAQALHGVGPFFFIGFDYAFGRALERDTTEALRRLGGTVVGVRNHPLGTTEFSAYIFDALASKAKVVAFASTGTDFSNAVKQAAEFGLNRSATLTGLVTMITDVDAIGLHAAQGLIVTEAFYWNQNDDARAFAKRFAERMPGRVPTQNHAGTYSSVLAYLRAAHAADSIEGEQVLQAMRSAPIEDKLFGRVVVRPDGRAVHDMYVFRVKSPAESMSRWDVYEPLRTIPAAEAFRPMNAGGCPLAASSG